ncbi:MAG: helix-turn-helix domain-containing protein [Balneolaceae bacterium]|nr:helix-turn-helix domain-containing protein [Balneolaceae bacterium]
MPTNLFRGDALLENVWRYEHSTNTRTVDVHISKLRSKIEEYPDDPRYPGHLARCRLYAENGLRIEKQRLLNPKIMWDSIVEHYVSISFKDTLSALKSVIN